MAVFGAGSLRRRLARGLFPGPSGRRRGLGNDAGAPFASGSSLLLALGRADRGGCSMACKKNIAFFENFICIWRKMGYNMVE